MFNLITTLEITFSNFSIQNSVIGKKAVLLLAATKSQLYTLNFSLIGNKCPLDLLSTENIYFMQFG